MNRYPYVGQKNPPFRTDKTDITEHYRLSFWPLRFNETDSHTSVSIGAGTNHHKPDLDGLFGKTIVSQLLKIAIREGDNQEIVVRKPPEENTGMTKLWRWMIDAGGRDSPPINPAYDNEVVVRRIWKYWMSQRVVFAVEELFPMSAQYGIVNCRWLDEKRRV
jgi:hypothetical protein